MVPFTEAAAKHNNSSGNGDSDSDDDREYDRIWCARWDRIETGAARECGCEIDADAVEMDGWLEGGWMGWTDGHTTGDGSGNLGVQPST